MPDKSQKERTENKDDFESVAKRLECDEDKGRSEAKLGKIASSKSKGTITP